LSFSPQVHSLGFDGNFLLPLRNVSSTGCTEGFHVDDFFRWLDEFQPTWLLTVPAILREILEQSSHYSALIKRVVDPILWRKAVRHSCDRWPGRLKPLLGRQACVRFLVSLRYIPIGLRFLSIYARSF
jgi:hypothetical protein